MIATIDLNVILDVYLLRGDYDAAMTVLSLCRTGFVSGNIPSHAAPTIYYILKKNLGTVRARELSGQLLDVFEIVPVDKDILLRARESAIQDFEDAIVEAAAIHARSDVIVTTNLRDFRASKVPVVAPEELLLRL